MLKHADKSYWRHITMDVTSQLPIQTAIFFHIFWRALVPPIWKRLLRHCPKLHLTHNIHANTHVDLFLKMFIKAYFNNINTTNKAERL